MTNKRHLSIAQRLALGFGLVLMLAAAIAAIGLWRLHDSAQETRAMMQKPLAKERLASDWYANLTAGVRRTAAIARSSDPSLVAFFADDVAQASKASTAFQKGLEALLSSDAERGLFTQLVDARKRFIAARDRIAALKTEGHLEQAMALLESDFRPAATTYLDSMRALQQLQRDDLDARSRRIDELNAASAGWVIGLGAVAIMLGVMAAWVITRSIVAPLQQAVRAAQRVAGGDLSVELARHRNDETGQLLASLQDMQHRLAEVVSRVRGNADSVANASAEIAHGNLDLSQRTEQQAASLQETAATMAQLSQTVSHNADSAQQARHLAEGANEVAARGGATVGEVVQTMRNIQQKSDRIGDIISVIDGIAFQTNILALNAAVEAARAGEQGRGFAVVAGEVRTLAQRSAQAAREIKTLITDSMEQVQQGTGLVDHAGATMGEIVEAIQRVSAIVAEISAASADQNGRVQVLNGAVDQMDRATQQNAALVEQGAAAAESLRQQSAQLVEAVAVFRVR